MHRIKLIAAVETWPLREPFVIARGVKTEAHVVVATITDGKVSGHGECVPYARYGESVEGVLAAIEGLAQKTDVTIGRSNLAGHLPPGAARNAVDCALWDYEAKASGTRAYARAGLSPPGPCETCFTISLGTPDEMAAKAGAVAHMPLLKLKLGGAGDAERVAAVRAAVPQARLVADANESWTTALWPELMTACVAARVELVEQPLPTDEDRALAVLPRPVPICADESFHTGADLARLAGRYDAVNIKLDKTGGLTEALAVRSAARAQGLKVMVGCMVATSLAMAPALLLAQDADWVDLDGPLLLASDRMHGLRYEQGVVFPPEHDLWG